MPTLSERVWIHALPPPPPPPPPRHLHGFSSPNIMNPALIASFRILTSRSNTFCSELFESSRVRRLPLKRSDFRLRRFIPHKRFSVGMWRR
jgi:hypothetical protein